MTPSVLLITNWSQFHNSSVKDSYPCFSVCFHTLWLMRDGTNSLWPIRSMPSLFVIRLTMHICGWVLFRYRWRHQAGESLENSAKHLTWPFRLAAKQRLTVYRLTPASDRQSERSDQSDQHSFVQHGRSSHLLLVHALRVSDSLEKAFQLRFHLEHQKLYSANDIIFYIWPVKFWWWVINQQFRKGNSI